MKTEKNNFSPSAASITEQLITGNSKKFPGLRDLFEFELKDAYWSEKALLKIIPDMIEKANSEELSEMLSEYLGVKEEQVTRLDEVFDAVGINVENRKCLSMENLLKEAQEMMAKLSEGSACDAVILTMLERAEQYIVASYGTLYSLAGTLHEHEATYLLETILKEQKKADEALFELSSVIKVVSSINNPDWNDEYDVYYGD